MKRKSFENFFDNINDKLAQFAYFAFISAISLLFFISCTVAVNIIITAIFGYFIHAGILDIISLILAIIPTFVLTVKLHYTNIRCRDCWIIFGKRIKMSNDMFLKYDHNYDLEKWLDDNCEGLYLIQDSTIVFFKTNDAILYKLAEESI